MKASKENLQLTLLPFYQYKNFSNILAPYFLQMLIVLTVGTMWSKYQTCPVEAIIGDKKVKMKLLIKATKRRAHP